MDDKEGVQAGEPFDSLRSCTVGRSFFEDAASASEFLQHSALSNITASVFSQTSLNTSKLTPSLTRSGAGIINASPSLIQSTAGPSSSSGQQSEYSHFLSSFVLYDHSDISAMSLQQTVTTTATSLSSGVLTQLFAVPMSSTPEQQGLQIPGFIDSRSPAVRSGRFPTPSALALTPRPGKGGNALAIPAVSRILRQK